MPDIAVLRALVEGNDDNLTATLARADANINAWANKSRTAPRLTITDNTGAVRTRIADLNRDIANLGKSKLNVNVGVNIPKNAARDLKDIAGLQLKNSTATITVNRAGNADSKDLRALGRIASELKDKTVTLTVNWQQNGTPPPPMPNGGGPMPPGGGGGGRPLPPPPRARSRMEGLQTSGYRDLMSGSIITASITQPLMRAAEGAIGESSEFEKRMRLVGGLTNIGIENIQKYRAELLKLANDDSLNSKGPKELAEAFFLAASKNKDGVSALEALKAAAHGATAGLGEVKDVEGGVTSVLNAFNMSADKSDHLMDVFLNTVKQGGVAANQFVTALPKVASTAAAAGLSVEEMSASIATMTRVGIPAGNAATALNRLLLSIIKPSDKAKATIKDLGTTFDQVLRDIKGKGLQATLQDLVGRAKGDISRLVPVLGPANSIKAVLSTQVSQPEEYRRIVQSYSHIDGLTDKAAENATQGFAVQVERLKSAIESAAIEIGDRLAPKLAPVVKFLRDTMPIGVKTTIAAWDSLDPIVRKGIAGMVGLLAISGPMLVAIGTGKVLASVLIPALEGIAGGFLGLAAAGPAGWAAIAALGLIAVAAGAQLGDLYEKTLQLKEAQDEAAASTAAMVKQLDKAAKVASAAPDAKKGIEALNTALTGAGDNTAKLLKVLRDANAAKVEVGKDMKLSPLGKAVAERELQQFINNLSARVIELGVNVSTVDRTNGRVTGATKEQDIANSNAAEKAKRVGNGGSWTDRAKAAGIMQPEPRQKGPDDLSYFTDYQEWQNKIIAAEQKRATTTQATAAVVIPLTKAETAALHEQREAVGKLTDAQLKHERARLTHLYEQGKLTAGNPGFDGDALTRAGNVENEYNRREENHKSDRAKAHADALAATQKAELARIAAANETAERLRSIEAKSLSDRLQMWNSFGNAVEGVVKQLGVTGAEKTDLQAWALQAQMAKREFADIPKPLRDIVVGLGAINDEMKALTSTRDEMRGMFTDLFKDAVRSGADLGPLKEAAAFMEKNLDFERRMKGYYNRGASASKKVIDYTEGQRAGISSRQEQLQETGRTKGDVYSEPGVGGGAAVSIMQGIARQFDGAQTVSACALVAGKMMRAVGINIPQNNSARGLRENAKAMGAHEISMAQAKAGDLINWVGGKYGAGGSGNHVGVYEGGGYYSGNHGKKNVNPMALHEKVSDLARAHFYNTSDFIGGTPKAGAMPASTARAGNIPPVVVKKERKYEPPPSPNYNGDLLQMGLPKGWGKAVTDRNLGPQESRAWQLKYQDMILDTEKATKNAKELGMSLNEYAAMWKRITARQDASDMVSKASDEASKRAREMGRSADFARSGRSNPISEYLYNAGKGDYNRTPKAKREGEFNGLVNMSLAQSVAETREFTRAQDSRNKVLAAGRPFLQGATTDLAAYDRATALAQSRVEAWKDLQGRRDEIASIMDSARAAGKKGDVKTVVARTNQARDLQREHDRLFKMKSEGAANEYDAGTASRAQAELASQQVAAREESELLDYEAGLIAKGVRNQEERSKLVEMEKVRRDTIKRLVDSQPYNSPEQYAQFTAQAEEAARLRGQSIDTQAGNAAGQESRDASDASALKQRLLANQLATAGRYGSDNPELAVQLQLLEERNKLDTDNLTRTNAAKINVDARMKTIEAEIRAEAVLSRYQTERGNLLEAQNGALDAQKQNELALASTAAERLAIEWKYTDALRARQGITTGPEEMAAREEQAQHAAEGERLTRYRSEAEAVGSMFHDSIADGFHNGIGSGLKGLGKRIMDAMLEAEFTKISNKIVGLPTDPNAPTAGGIWGAVMGRKSPTTQGPRDAGNPVSNPGDFLASLKAGVGGRGTSTNPFIPDARAMPTGIGGIGAQVAQAIQGGISAAQVIVNSTATEVRGNTVNVAEGRGFSPNSGRASGGGSGSSSGDTEAILQLVTMFAG